MAKEEYVAVSSIKHGRASEAFPGGEIIEWEAGEDVDPSYFTQEQFDKLIALGSVASRPASQRALKLEEELAAKEAEIAELRAQLSAQQTEQTQAQQEAQQRVDEAGGGAPTAPILKADAETFGTPPAADDKTSTTSKPSTTKASDSKSGK